jgi:hypothetical protein
MMVAEFRNNSLGYVSSVELTSVLLLILSFGAETSLQLRVSFVFLLPEIALALLA